MTAWIKCEDCKYRMKPFYVCTLNGKRTQLIMKQSEITGCSEGIKDV